MESQPYDRDIEIVEVKPIEGEGLVFIEGFPDIGLVGAIAASYLIDKLQLEEVGYIDAVLLPPIISVWIERINEHIRIYKGGWLVSIVIEYTITDSC